MYILDINSTTKTVLSKTVSRCNK